MLRHACMPLFFVLAASLTTTTTPGGGQDTPTLRQLGYSVPVPYSPFGYFLRQTFQSPTLDAIRDILLVTAVGIPLMGLMALGGLVMLPLFGVNLGAIGLGALSSNTATSAATAATAATSSGIKFKRSTNVSVMDRMLELMDQLEGLLTDQGLLHEDCKYRFVCEAHLKMGRRNGTDLAGFTIKNLIKDIIREEQELEAEEWVPISQFVFEPYVEAAKRGSQLCHCADAYPYCPHLNVQGYPDLQKQDNWL